MKDIQCIITLGEVNKLPSPYNSLSLNQIKKLSNGELKGLLFEYHLSSNNIESYKQINIRSQYYLMKLNQSILEEGFTLWEEIFEQNKVFEMNRLER